MVAIPVILGALVVAGIALVLILSRLIHICPPNEVLVFSGTTRQVSDNKGGYRDVGYRLVQGGRGIRIPLMERVDRLDLTIMIIDLKVQGAYAKGGIPLNVEGIANVKIGSTEEILGNGIERLLGKPREEIMRVARETLEGNLRGVLATMTPEEVNQDRVKFSQELLAEADKDLQGLGLELDTLKIQSVSDDRGYLDSLGRRQSADLLMRSRIAEAENRALAAEKNASNTETKEIAALEAEIAKARAEAEKRIVDASTRKTAMVAEQRGQVTAAVARANAELGVQRARLEQVRFRLVADEIKPAEARRSMMLEQARGNAAQSIEEGKATAAALRALAATWRENGDSARQIVVAQKLNSLVGSLMSTVSSLPIDKVTFIDKELGGGGDGNLAVKAAITSEQIKHTMGIDVPALLNKIGGSSLPGAKAQWIEESAISSVE
ncbi:MAG: flotillin family protein [Myxococcales bacterium]|nr:flotillin family protein [Myxococcales bacterium]